jgi:uncharacterized glyoxalase superfamily protein PhnB
VATLRCANDVGVCPGCLDWLRGQMGVAEVTPILPVRDLDEALGFYKAAGFEVRADDDGGYAFVSYQDEGVFDLDEIEGLDPATNAAGCFIVVDRVDQWHHELEAAGLSVTRAENQPWGMREFTLTDPSGNRLRIGRGV